MNAQQLEEIKERVAKATPGEWDVFDDIWVAQGDGLTIGENIAKCEVEADADFIAHARQDVPELVAEVERLREALAFYANNINYSIVYNKNLLGSIAVDKDRGEIARQALREDNNV